jgi:p-aminobenzoyl-glutamate transporter AbgT
MQKRIRNWVLMILAMLLVASLVGYVVNAVIQPRGYN